jgi:hypothetical protein
VAPGTGKPLQRYPWGHRNRHFEATGAAFSEPSGALLTRNETTGEDPMFKSSQAVSHGISFGTALAIAISWSANKSILWAIIHGFFSWLYVIYYALTRY